MKREVKKMDFKTFCSVLGLESFLAFVMTGVFSRTEPICAPEASTLLAFLFFQESKDFKWFEIIVVLVVVFLLYCF